MSRFEGDFSAAGEASLNATELLNLLGREGQVPPRELQQAIACYLSASEGWDQAQKLLRGAFASDAAAAVRSDRNKQG